MTESIPLYPGDTGELGLETRRALVQLLKGPLVTAEKHPEIWRTIIRDERVLRSRLTERLTFMDTAMVLALRHRLLRAQPGERVIVDFDEVTAQLEMYRGATSTDPAGFRRRVHSSWEKLKKYSLLASTSTEGRMEVSPVLRQLFDADQVAAVEAEFRRIVEGSPM